MSSFVLTLEPPPPLVRFLAPHPEGAGPDLAKVEQRIRELRDDYQHSLAMTYREAVLTEVFRSFAEEWRQTTRFQSSLTQITDHPAYRAIVRLGEEVVPLLLRELQRRQEPWFTALREITGADPVKPEQRGDMGKMAEAWLRWGRSHGLMR
jgi:hypothetical protein